nr:PAS domain-containing sensor histidine kinase [Nitrosomonas nitrosa]
MSDRKGLAALCDETGKIIEIISNDLTISINKHENLIKMIDHADRVKFERFFAATLSHDAAFDWEIHVLVNDQPLTLHFGAAHVDQQIIVIAAESRKYLVRLSEQIANDTGISLSRLRQVLQETTRQINARTEQDRHLYDELSRLNNQLATTQRMLIKSNVQLSRANQELRALYDSLPVGVFSLDEHGQLVQANALYFTLAGVDASQHWLERVNVEDKARLQAAWRRAITEALPFENQYQRNEPGKSPRYLSIKTLPLQNERGESNGFVGVMEDISVRLRAEEQMREIERQNAVRKLTGGLAHHLNNIMLVILGSAEQLLDELSPTDTAYESAKMNMRATERAASLVRRLKIFSGIAIIEANAIGVNETLISLKERIDQVLPKTCKLVLDLQATGATIKADSSVFEESIIELIINANQAMNGQGVISLCDYIEADACHEDRRWVIIQIEDSGCGMDEITLKRVREPFFSTREIGQGIGLGLSLVDGFARASGGILEIESELNRGTCVKLKLPLADSREGVPGEIMT